MSKVRGKDTRPELRLRGLLYAQGYRFRKNYRVGNRTIDIAFPKKKVAIFVDGCFWHGCPLHYRRPKSNQEYWAPKIRRNKERDRESTAMLRSLGWKVVRLWEHQLKDMKAIPPAVLKTLRA